MDVDDWAEMSIKPLINHVALTACTEHDQSDPIKSITSELFDETDKNLSYNYSNDNE